MVDISNLFIVFSLRECKSLDKIVIATTINVEDDIVENFAKKIKAENPLEAFEQALENAKPALEVKSRRIGGATYQVPIEIPANRRSSMAMRWIINYSRSKPGRSMEDALAAEFADCYNNQGSTIKKKDDTHRMAEANKAYAHYKW